MNTAVILSAINKHVSLDETETAFLSEQLISKKLKPAEFLEESGEMTKFMIYVNSGCLMTYYTDPGGVDHVIQFATSGWWTGDLHSLHKNVPSIYSTRALTESEVLLLPKVSLELLLAKHIKFERYFRIIFQNALVVSQQRIVHSYSYPAEERYRYFSEKYPNLEQYVPLKYIASYLGITPEFLSKIRRKLMDGK
jgi:CRP-like cAMP-binding protein